MAELDRRGLLAAGAGGHERPVRSPSRDPDAPGIGGLSGGAVADRRQARTGLDPARHPGAVGQCAWTLRAGADHPGHLSDRSPDRVAGSARDHGSAGAAPAETLVGTYRGRRGAGWPGLPGEPLWPARGPAPSGALPQDHGLGGTLQILHRGIRGSAGIRAETRSDHRGQPPCPRRVLAALGGAVELPRTGPLAGRTVHAAAIRGREPGGGRRLARRVRTGRGPAGDVRAGISRPGDTGLARPTRAARPDRAGGAGNRRRGPPREVVRNGGVAAGPGGSGRGGVGGLAASVLAGSRARAGGLARGARARFDGPGRGDHALGPGGRRPDPPRRR